MSGGLPVGVLRELTVADAGGVRPLAAASGLVRVGQRLYVVADDENHIGCFDLDDGGPGRLVRLFPGELPAAHRARKAAKPDAEALLHLPPLPGCPHGALLALGSGSRRSRRRAACVALDAAGLPAGPAREVDVSPLLAPLEARIADLNIEGGFFDGERCCLLQRGNGKAAIDAVVEWRSADVLAWLARSLADDPAAAAPAPVAITRHELGSIGGVRLSFTDAAVLPGGRWLFTAAAEGGKDSYEDGERLGSAVGVVDAAGRVERSWQLAIDAKVEGVAARCAGGHVELLMVTDGDDRDRPALLLAATLPGAAFGAPAAA